MYVLLLLFIITCKIYIYICISSADQFPCVLILHEHSGPHSASDCWIAHPSVKTGFAGFLGWQSFKRMRVSALRHYPRYKFSASFWRSSSSKGQQRISWCDIHWSDILTSLLHMLWAEPAGVCWGPRRGHGNGCAHVLCMYSKKRIFYREDLHFCIHSLPIQHGPISNEGCTCLAGTWRLLWMVWPNIQPVDTW